MKSIREIKDYISGSKFTGLIVGVLVTLPIMYAGRYEYETYKIERAQAEKETHQVLGPYHTAFNIDSDEDADVIVKIGYTRALYIAPDMRDNPGRFIVDENTEDMTPEMQVLATQNLTSGIALEELLGIKNL